MSTTEKPPTPAVTPETASTPPRPPAPRPAKPVPPPYTLYHGKRKLTHLICFVIFVALPFFNIIRADIPRQRFYFFGVELLINEFGIIFFAMMFLMFLLTASAMLYGRMYCSYLCPQMIFSEFFAGLHERLKKYVNKKFIQMSAPRRATLARVLFHLILLPASVFLSFVFISYFVTPLDLLHRLLRLDVTTAGGIAGATTTILTFLDFAFLRLKFCTTVCPYGYLQGFLSDDHTLLVHYRDETKECIECKKCIRVCPMDIDIRTSPYQIECVHCADCVDACNEIMGKLGKKGLIHYTWGEQGAVAEKEQTSWVRRLGLRDGKRAVVLFVLLFYAIGLTVALSMRNTIQVQLSPDRTVLFKALPDGRVANHFRLRIANRGHQDAHLNLKIEDLPGATIEGLALPVTIASGANEQKEFDIVVPPSANTPPGVNHIRITAQLTPDKDQTFPTTFITPTEKTQSPAQ